MSQYTGTTSLSPPWPGATSAADFQKLLDHVLSQGSGASRPANLAAGGIWAEDVGGGQYDLYLFDGTSDLLVHYEGVDIGSVTPAAGVFTTLMANSMDATPIGATTPAVGTFTTIRNGTLTGNALAADTGSGMVATTNGVLGLSADSESALKVRRTGTNGYAAVFYKNTTAVGTIEVLAASTNYNTTSDYRVKQHVEPISGAIRRLSQIHPVNFAFTAEPGVRVDGFIAHELQDVLPYAVAGTKDAVDEHGEPDLQSVDYSKLTPLLTAALQEAIARIEALEAKIGSAI